MSASSKKKLRKEQNAAFLTEKQRSEQAEAKKLKTYSIIFIAIMLVVAIIALTVMAIKIVNRTGILEKNTIAATVNNHKINSVEFNYYFNDAINYNYNMWSSLYGENMAKYLADDGLDLNKPLNTQTYDENTTWADYFVMQALNSIAANYALYDKAQEEDFALTREEEADAVSEIVTDAVQYASSYGYTDLEDYLQAVYGFGATQESYLKYKLIGKIADAYYTAYSEDLTFTDDELQEHEAKDYKKYSSYSYVSYYLNHTKFLEGGTKDEDGNVTYSEEEREAARAAAKEVADSLATATSVIDLDKKIAALEINKDVENAASNKSENVLYSNVLSSLRDWITDESRQEGDITVLPRETTTTNDDGKEVTTIAGYYVTIYQGCNENKEPLSDVRHLLVAFEGGKTDSETGVTTYSDEEKAAAKKEAEKLLEQWKSGDATEDSFIALIKEHSDDTSAETGGLFENITPDSSYLEPFLSWAIDSARQKGDAEIVETQYGYHIMYYVGDSDITYRDYLISEELRSGKVEAWYTEVVESVTCTLESTSRVDMDKVLG